MKVNMDRSRCHASLPKGHNKLELLEQLETEDQQTIINVIDSMLTKKKMLDLLLKKERVAAI
jgi:hypothetical protein